MSIGVGTTTVQTPLTRNFGGMKSYVAAFVQGASITSILSDAGVAINAAIDYLNMEKWNFLNTSTSLTLTATSDSVTVPANFKKPLKLFRINGDGNRDGRIRFKEPGVFFDELRVTLADGFPAVYTVVSQAVRTIHFDRAPNAEFISSFPTLELRYWARLLHFSDDGDTIGGLTAPPELWSFLAWYARWDLATVRGSQRQADLAERQWVNLAQRIRRDDLDTHTDWD